MSKTNKMDAEYNAMRRRMSRVRVKHGKGQSLEAEEAPSSDDPGFKDLIKYWKKHGIPIPHDLLSDMADENVKQGKAHGKGRRRSKELEDLHMCASTGKFNLDRVDSVEEEEVESSTPRKKPVSRSHTESSLLGKARGSSMKKVGSGGSINGVVSPAMQKKLSRSVSKT